MRAPLIQRLRRGPSRAAPRPLALTPLALMALLLMALLLLLLLASPAPVRAEEQAPPPTTTTPPPASGEATTTVPAPPAPAPTPTTSTEASPPTPPTETSEAPEVQARHAQRTSPGGTRKGRGHSHTQGPAAPGSGAQPQGEGGTLAGEGQPGAGRTAPPPSSLTPRLPFSLGASIAGVPAFFIESFQIPPFLLPIYQAAGTAYGIPWQVLAAINEVETDYGRDLSVSSAGAEGWMQFLPSTWAQYGVDANGDGFKDPYNPADAVFTAARYLRAAGGDTNIRAAVYSYNHSQAYVASVMLRAQLLGGTPPGLFGAITGLTESRFPVHAPARFSDGFQTVPAHGTSPARALTGTTIYTQPGAPVIAVQDGEVTQLGVSPALGHFIALRDVYGNTYVYAQLGSVASLYPVLKPHEHTAVSGRIAQPGVAAREPAPSGPATAGAQQRSPLSAGATESGLALGAAAGLEPAPAPPTPAPTPVPAAPKPAPASVRVFREGPNDVYLHPLRVGVQVIAGTVLGHVGVQATGEGQTGGEPHMFFQIKPAGVGAPLIDPKPILDGWVALENTSIFHAKGENPFLATSPSVGQVLLESKAQLEQQVARDRTIGLAACERREVQTGRVDKRVLATLEFLSVSGLKPTVTGLRCASAAEPSAQPGASGGADELALKITSVNGLSIAGHQGPGSIADTTIRKLLTLQGINRPLRILSATNVPGAGNNVIVKRGAGDYIAVAFTLPGGARAAAASAGSPLSASEWIKLIARLGEIPDPTVASGPSTAALPDGPVTPAPAGGGRKAAAGAAATSEGAAGGHG